MHSRGRMTMDPLARTMPGRGTSAGFHLPGTAEIVLAPSEKRREVF